MWYTDVKKGFGLAIKRWRQESGISQEELAWRAGLHRSYVADIERGARNASLQTIEKLAKALKISFSALFEPLDGTAPANRLSGAQGGKERAVDILLVEDNPKDVELSMKAFAAARLTNPVEVVQNGADALDFIFCRGAFSTRDINQAPRVLLLDLNLPKVPGMEVLRRVKADPRTRGIRVVVLTISRKDEHIAQALRLGAEAYIVKPVDFQSLTEVTPRLNFSWTLLEPGVAS
ncbi:MAG TPA: helix-turn-helix domain-containing protein [Verrucomicrobiae bacterium]|nr:helix-turn-helix domain-containing protein [Verrucomicrobiae bacterium]